MGLLENPFRQIAEQTQSFEQALSSASEQQDRTQRQIVLDVLRKHAKKLPAIGSVLDAMENGTFDTFVRRKVLDHPEWQTVDAAGDMEALRGTYGERYVSLELAAHAMVISYREQRKRENFPARPPCLGFEHIDGLDLGEYLEAALPPNWLQGTDDVRMSGEDFTKRLLLRVNKYPGLKVGASAYFKYGVDRKPHVTVSQEWLEELRQKNGDETAFMHLQYILRHELSHGNDRQMSAAFSPEERLAWWTQATQLAHAEGRPLVPYPESIKSEKDNDKEEVKYKKTKEYFAELCAYSLTCPGADWETWERNLADWLVRTFKAQPNEALKNAVFVHRYLEASAPGFKPREAAASASRIQERQLSGRRYRGMFEMVRHVEDHDLRAALRRILIADLDTRSPEALDAYEHMAGLNNLAGYRVYEEDIAPLMNMNMVWARWEPWITPEAKKAYELWWKLIMQANQMRLGRGHERRIGPDPKVQQQAFDEFQAAWNLIPLEHRQKVSEFFVRQAETALSYEAPAYAQAA